MDAYLHITLCVIGLTLTLVRLRIVARPHPTVECRVRWCAWVAAHALWAVGFAAGIVHVIAHEVPVPFAAWAVRGGLVLWLLLRIRRQPEADR